MGGDLHHFTGLHPAEPFGEVGFEIPHRHLACDYFRHTYYPICDHFSRFPRRCGAERSPGHQGSTAPPSSTGIQKLATTAAFLDKSTGHLIGAQVGMEQSCSEGLLQTTDNGIAPNVVKVVVLLCIDAHEAEGLA